MTKKSKQHRLDESLVQSGHANTIDRARALIMAGHVRVSGIKASSPAQKLEDPSEIQVVAPERFVSRGAWKLDGALEHFSISVKGLRCADVGAATGGFSDALLQRGAEHVYAVDVGYGDLDWKIRSNPRVTPIERTNARYLEALPELVQFVVIDASFISLTLLLPTVRNWLTEDGAVVALIKPQFEEDRDKVPPGGIIEDRAQHRAVIERTAQCALQCGFGLGGLIPSSLKGSQGNQEYLIWLRLGIEGVTVESLVLSVK